MKKLILLFPILISANSFAKYSWLLCEKGTDAYSCSGSCKEVNGMSADFKINAEKNTVIYLQYQDKKLGYTETLENCKVIDNKNWECNSDYGMVEGKWYSRSKVIAKTNPDVDFGQCGKYSIFK